MRLATAITLIALLLPSLHALAQTAPYPVKPIRLIVPFPAGASSDIVGRMLGQKAAEQLGELLRADIARFGAIVRGAGLPRQ